LPKSATSGFASTNAFTAGTPVSEYPAEVSQPSSVSVNQVTASPPCPPSMMALRALSDSETTCAFRCERIWSVKDGTCRRYALSPPVTGTP
jgi:hypothetical protein